MVRLAPTIGEVRFWKKFGPKTTFWEKRFRGLSRQNRAKFLSRTILPPNAPNSLFGLKTRWGGGFVKEFGPKTCFFGETKLHSETILPPIAPYGPFGPENRWGAVSYKNSNRKRVFGKNDFRGFRGKIERSFCPEQFCPQTCHIVRLAPKIAEGAVL